ncbi:hypothetical protein [Roseofilum casamattae]|uniref:DUF1574 domain-containing protein n=1 Tax=Roseofilum casamattae BLCC-M143 TaxID=3022442 RepID=A0ABT7BSX8_9CYAN|nr:hypothetical protein [Roseofilum casamattae]MDJ1181624.1 hypothetical protein [Roseofilum casamattae BLCC-M143]
MSSINSTPTIGKGTPISQWAQDTIGSDVGKVKVRLRGNILHILCESTPISPPQERVESRLIAGLLETDLNPLLPENLPPIYHIWLYGRVSGPNYPDWTKEIDLTSLLESRDRTEKQEPGDMTDRAMFATSTDPELERTVTAKESADSARLHPSSAVAVADRAEGESAIGTMVSNRNLAAEGHPHAIARYVSETLSPLGIGVKVKIKTLKQHLPTGASIKRLHVGCYSNYSPDPSLLGPKIAGQLRELELSGFRDAAIASQVHGETSPDWVLLVDLTPRSVMLDGWARWGDVPAISRLLDRQLARASLKVSAILKDSTLHLFCRSNTVTEKDAVSERIRTLLNAIAPQGIHAATIYGHLNNQSTPLWVDWLDLPAKSDKRRRQSTLQLAKEGDRSALQFLLNRLLNPDLDRQLSTGGIRIQLLLKDDLLHVMSDAPVCPDRREVGPLVAKFLRQLKIAGISGVRVYGRRAGQKLPRWNYGVDFQTRKRLVPEAPPEFAASSAYVGDLIALDRNPSPSETAEKSTEALANALDEVNEETTGLAVPSEAAEETITEDAAPETAPSPSQPRRRFSLLHYLQRFSIRLGLLTPALSSSSARDRQPSPMLSPTREELQSQSASVSPVLTNATETAKPGKRPVWQVNPQLASAFVWGVLGLLIALEVDWLLGYQLLQANEHQPTANYLSLGGDPANASDESLSGSADGQECELSQCALSPPSPYPSFNNQLIDEHLGRYHALMLSSGAPDIVIIGSSRALRGIDPQRLKEGLAEDGIEEVEIYNFGINGATAKVVDWVIRELLTQEQLPKLIIWADGTRAFNSGREDLTYEAIARSDGYQALLAQTLERPAYGTPWGQQSEVEEEPEGKGKARSLSITQSYEQANDWLQETLGTFSAVYPHRDRLHEEIRGRLTAVLPEQQSPELDEEKVEMLQPAILNPDGFLPFKIRFDPETYYETHPQVSGAYDRDYESFSLEGEQHEALENAIAYTQAKGVGLMFINMPLTDVYLDPVRSDYESRFQEYIMAKEQPGFIVQDWMTLWSGGEYEYFSDPSHLNRYGAEAIATELATDDTISWQKALQREE